MDRLVIYLALIAITGGCQFGLDPWCVYQCHCKDGVECNPITGACPAGCDGGGDPKGYMYRGAWGGPGCQVGNVAYGRPATGSSPSINPERAVDGDRTPTYRSRGGSCTQHQGGSWRQLVWQVNLGSYHVVHNVTIYGTDNGNIYGHNYWRNRVVEVGEGVDYQQCGSLGDSNTATMVHVVCPGPLKGRYVQIKASSGANGARLFLCEVYVNGYRYVGTMSVVTSNEALSVITECMNGGFGPGCLTGCNCQTQCDVISGNCSSGCKDDCQTPGHYITPTPPPSDTSIPYAIPTTSDTPTPSGEPTPSYSPTPSDDPTLSTPIDQATPRAVSPPSDQPPKSDPPLSSDQPSTSDGVSSADPPPPGTSSGAIAGAVVAVLLIAALIILVLFLRRHQLKRIFTKENDNVAFVTESPMSVGGVDNNGLSIDKVIPGTPHQSLAACHSVNEEEEDENRNVYGNQKLPESPVNVQNLSSHIQEMKSRPGAFQSEFSEIPSGQRAKWAAAGLTVNKGKNRFNNIMAYDHSRVKLDVSKHDQGQGYINANFIPAYKNKEQGYIASQGPRIHTVIDMWQMIWQYKINRVVMVTKIMEDYKAKCEYYWPEADGPEEVVHGKFKVRAVKTEQYADYAIRTLSVTYKGESRSVTQFHYLSWPDHGSPQSTASLLEFRRKVRAQDNIASGPLVVHCSAGVGRTGAFIAIDYSLDQAKAEDEVDVMNFTALMRSYRVNMIQNADQYTFVYDALLLALQPDCGAIPASDIAQVLPSLLTVDPETGQSPLIKQFEFLNSIKTPDPDTPSDGLTPENIDKNRSRTVIPRDNCRPFLFPRKDLKNNYINASFIHGYRRLQAYIVTQMPFPQTLCDFWRLMYDHKSPSLLTIHDFSESQPEDETCPPCWPTEVGGALALEFLEVEMETEEILTDDLVVRQFKMTNIQDTEEEPRTVRQFHLQGWTEDTITPPDPDKLLTLLEALERWQQQSGDGTITVQCKNGVHQSGVVCAVGFLLDKLKVDQEIDAFLAVTQIRLGRPQLIDSFEQYVFLHEIAMKYMGRNEMYANFKNVE